MSQKKIKKPIYQSRADRVRQGAAQSRICTLAPANLVGTKMTPPGYRIEKEQYADQTQEITPQTPATATPVVADGSASQKDAGWEVPVAPTGTASDVVDSQSTVTRKDLAGQ